MQQETDRPFDQDTEAEAPTERTPTLADYLAPNQPLTDPAPAATTAAESAEAPPDRSPEAPPESTTETPAEDELPYRLGQWSGLPAVFCRWRLPNGSECGTGFLTEQEFWDHQTMHVIRAMTPEQQAAAILAAQAAQNPSVIVGPNGQPLPR